MSYIKVGIPIDGVQLILNTTPHPIIKKQLYGCETTDSKITIPCLYTDIKIINSHLIIANKWDAMYGIIDINERVILPFNYERIELTKDGLISLSDSHINGGFDFGHHCEMDLNLQLHTYDTTGNVILPRKYTHADGFCNGLCIVEHNGFWGVINRDFMEVIPCIFQKIHNEYVPSEIRDENTLTTLFVCEYKKSCYDDEKVKEVLIHFPSNKIIDVHKDFHLTGYTYHTTSNSFFKIEYIKPFNPKCRLFGLMDYFGNYMLPCIYEKIDLINGSFSLVKDGKKGLATNNGTLLFPCEYSLINKVDIGNKVCYILTNINGDQGVADESGKIIIPLRYKCILSLVYDEFYYFKIIDSDGRCGLSNIDGLVIVPCEYDDISKFNEDFFITDTNVVFDRMGKEIFSKDMKIHSISITEQQNYILSKITNEGKKFGLYSRSGEELIPCEFTFINEYKDGIVLTQNALSLWRVYDINNRKVLFDNLKVNTFGQLSEGIITFRGDCMGFININTGQVYDTIYDSISNFSSGLSLVTKKDSSGRIFKGYIDYNNNLIIPLEYTFATYFNNGTARVCNDKGCFIIDKSGKIINVVEKNKSFIKYNEEAFYSSEELRSMYYDAFEGDSSNEWNID